MSKSPRDRANLEAFDRFWHRALFHDEVIKEVVAINKRVLIRLTEMTLIVTGAIGLSRCELPADWLAAMLVPKSDGFVLDVETTSGHLKVTGSDVRLIRNRDLAVLIPPIDA